VTTVVLSLIDGFERAGAYRSLLLVNSYPQRQFVRRTHPDVLVFYEYFVPAPFDVERKLKSILSYFIRLPLAMLRFIAFIRRNNIRAVDVHYPGLSALTILLARFMTLGAFKVVLSFHGTDLPHCPNLVQRLIWRFILRRADAVVACSHSLAQEFRRVNRGIAVQVVHNAVDSAACRNKALQSKRPPGLEDRRYIISVGKFEHKKAHDVLIESFERVAAIHPDLCLAIIGASGPAFGACQARAAISPSRDRMLIYRDVPHGSTLAAIAHATLLVLPSRREPFGVAILEAAALVTPVIASRIGGIPEIVQDGYSGILVSPNDVDALSDALLLALADPERSDAQAARLQESVGLKFSLPAQVRAYEHLFDLSRYCVSRDSRAQTGGFASRR
jgi:glycosyltransferase involved in cell wall biosynthesis